MIPTILGASFSVGKECFMADGGSWQSASTNNNHGVLACSAPRFRAVPGPMFCFNCSSWALLNCLTSCGVRSVDASSTTIISAGGGCN